MISPRSEDSLDIDVNSLPGHTAAINSMPLNSKERSYVVNLDNISGPVHLAGIGGIGMSALARLLLAQGKKVSGSDKQESEITNELKALGADIHIGHEAKNLESAGALVVSTAIVDGNPELEEAKRRGLPIWHRSDMLAYLARNEKLIAITGTHGKTTTTAMVGQVLIKAGLDPSIVVGGIFEHIGSNARHGAGGYFVAESDESDGTHVRCHPYISVITNIEPDHLENYPGGFDEILASMSQFLSNTEAFAIVCTDDSGVRTLLDKPCKTRIVTYGSFAGETTPDYAFENLPGFGMNVFKQGKKLGQVTMRVPGAHNKSNAVVAIVCAMELGADFESVKAALAEFGGVDRRFQRVGEVGGILVIDDYAHHPTEVSALLAAAREFLRVERGGKGRVVCLFQPHQPGRLRDLWKEFTVAFNEADLVLLTDIYVARGGAIAGIDSATFAKAVKNPNTHYLPGPVSTLAEKLLDFIKPDDIVLTVGAGDVTRVGPELVTLLSRQ